MDRDSFLETLRQQYAEDIREAYLECEHGKEAVDLKKLNAKLVQLHKEAKVDGLPSPDFADLVRAELPDVADKVTWDARKVAA